MNELKQINPCLPIMVERIVNHFQPLKIILFGSYARGTANRHSDIDLLVVFSEVENKSKQTIAIRERLSDLPVAKDIIVTTLDEIKEYGHIVGTILRPALKEGKVIYERK